MVFSSIPPYLDPANWEQQANNRIIGSTGTNPLLPPPPPPPPQHHGGAGSGSGSIRPGSMAERARVANIPMPETALKCPRCESANTKFCYFNNYNLSQPRHFCKTCRRYWTRGGALRSVPVGGGCRRNKRSKPSSSKSPASSDTRQTNSSSTSSSTISTNTGPGNTFPSLRFVSPLSQFSNSFTTHEMGLNYGGISCPMVVGSTGMNFPAAGNNPYGGGGGVEPWRFPNFLGGFDPSPPAHGIYQFPGGEASLPAVMRPRVSSSMLTEMESVKVEENPELNFSRQLMGGLMPRNHDQWNNNNASTAWTDLSSFSSFSTSNPL